MFRAVVCIYIVVSSIIIHISFIGFKIAEGANKGVFPNPWILYIGLIIGF